MAINGLYRMFFSSKYFLELIEVCQELWALSNTDFPEEASSIAIAGIHNLPTGFQYDKLLIL